MDNFLDEIDVPTIDPRIEEELEKPIQIEELISWLDPLRYHVALSLQTIFGLSHLNNPLHDAIL